MCGFVSTLCARRWSSLTPVLNRGNNEYSYIYGELTPNKRERGWRETEEDPESNGLRLVVGAMKKRKCQFGKIK